MIRSLSERVKSARSSSGLSQSAFSSYFHIPLETLSQWERGRREPPLYVVEMLERLVLQDFDGSYVISAYSPPFRRWVFRRLVADLAGVLESEDAINRAYSDFMAVPFFRGDCWLDFALDSGLVEFRDGRTLLYEVVHPGEV